MNRNRWIAPALLVLVLPVTAYAQTRTPINTQTLGTLTTSTTYVLSSGFDTKIYTLSPDVFSRVLLPTPDSTMPLTSIATRLGATSTPILVGTFTNLSAITFGFTSTTGTRTVAGTATAVKCDGTLCSCTGKIDCRDMAKANLCFGGANRNWWACDSKGCVCYDKQGDLL
jgi:hypothetical protein